jgi:hypothetical protein
MQAHHVYQLGKFEFDADPEDVRGVDHRPHQLVVVGEEVVVEAFGIRIAGHSTVHHQGRQQPGSQRLGGGRRHPDAAPRHSGATLHARFVRTMPDRPPPDPVRICPRALEFHSGIKMPDYLFLIATDPVRPS